MIFLGYFLKGLAGFGGALFSVSILIIFFEVRDVVPIISIVDIASGFILLPRIRNYINKRMLITISAGLCVGTTIGVYFLKSFSNHALEIIFAVLVIFFSLRMLFYSNFIIHKLNKLKIFFGSFFGLIAGITGGMFGADGPPVVLYLSNQIKDKNFLRGTLISIFLVGAIWRNFIYFSIDFFTVQVYQISLLMIPVLFMATFLGSKVNYKMNEKTYRLVTSFILLISGAIILVR